MPRPTVRNRPLYRISMLQARASHHQAGRILTAAEYSSPLCVFTKITGAISSTTDGSKCLAFADLVARMAPIMKKLQLQRSQLSIAVEVVRVVVAIVIVAIMVIMAIIAIVVVVVVVVVAVAVAVVVVVAVVVSSNRCHVLV